MFQSNVAQTSALLISKPVPTLPDFMAPRDLKQSEQTRYITLRNGLAPEAACRHQPPNWTSGRGPGFKHRYDTH